MNGPIAPSIDVHRQCVEMILKSMSKSMGDDGLLSSFMFGKPGGPVWDRRVGTELYYGHRSLTLACIFLRKNGPNYLRALAIGDIWRLVQNFVSENYWLLADDTFMNTDGRPFSEIVSDKTKLNFTTALATSDIFVPAIGTTLYPLIPVVVEADFVSDQFLLVSPACLPQQGLPTDFQSEWIKPEQFPPMVDWKGRVYGKVNAWLGVRSPTIQSSDKIKAAVLGALALTPLPRYRHQFSMRSQFGGRTTIEPNLSATTSIGEPHTPPMSNDVVVRESDHGWLRVLADKLTQSDKTTRRQVRALEYFYRAWPLDPSERFPVLCMALDAIFGDVSHATQAVIDGVRETIGSHVPDQRLRKLMNLRASVIHGGAPDVYDSSKYFDYYTEYETDPIYDMELVVARCIRAKIFGDKQADQPDPYAELIREQVEKGRIPRNFGVKGIVA